MIKDEKEPIALMWASHGFRNNVEAGYSGIAHANDAFLTTELFPFHFIVFDQTLVEQIRKTQAIGAQD